MRPQAIEDPRTAREHIYGYAYDGQGRLEEAYNATGQLGRQRAL
jgi:YD repeat-containing protein